MWFSDLLSNKVLIAAISAFVIAQLLKFIIYSIIDRKLDFAKLFATGSMPSSHAALVTAVCVGFAVETGFNTPQFTLAVVLALVVMHDASNVRRSVGKQAQLLNKMLIEMLRDRDFGAEKIKEILGHTPLEVFVGAVIGAIISLALCV